MRIYENPTTHRLEDKAEELKQDLEIRIIEPHKEGRYFVTAINGQELRIPASLGWTDAHAIESTRRNTWKGARLDSF